MQLTVARMMRSSCDDMRSKIFRAEGSSAWSFGWVRCQGQTRYAQGLQEPHRIASHRMALRLCSGLGLCSHVHEEKTALPSPTRAVRDDSTATSNMTDAPLQQIKSSICNCLVRTSVLYSTAPWHASQHCMAASCLGVRQPAQATPSNVSPQPLLLDAAPRMYALNLVLRHGQATSAA